MLRHEDMDNGHLYSRLHKTWCCVTCCFPCNALLHPCRKAVSGHKRRYIKDGFNLDLTEVAPRIIVHGFPSVGIEHLYRNPRDEIRRFMDHYHFEKYKMFNFCCEPGRGYDPEVFHGRVERYPFKDHNTPPLNTMAAFANSAKLWLDADPENVVNMHCKAGKGRAGLMCCVMLVRSGTCQSATEALDLYDSKRVTNNKGLTVTSQRKFVIFYETLWRKYWNVTGDIGAIPGDKPGETPKWVVPKEPEFRLYGIEVLNAVEGSLKNLKVHVYKGTNFLPEHRFSSTNATSPDQKYFECDCKIEGNFKVRVDHKGKVKVFEMWHNTLFLEKNVPHVDFGLDQLDIKKKVIPKYGKQLTLRLYFTRRSSSMVANEGLLVAGEESLELVVTDVRSATATL